MVIWAVALGSLKPPSVVLLTGWPCWLDGVDLSPATVDKARHQGAVYDELAVGDIVDYLEDKKGRYDLIIACDVLVYVGNLKPLTSACAAALENGGYYAFSTERLEETTASGYVLQGEGKRFAHCEAYLQQLAEDNGLVVEALEKSIIRQNGGKPICGNLCIMYKP